MKPQKGKNKTDKPNRLHVGHGHTLNEHHTRLDTTTCSLSSRTKSFITLGWYITIDLHTQVIVYWETTWAGLREKIIEHKDRMTKLCRLLVWFPIRFPPTNQKLNRIVQISKKYGIMNYTSSHDWFGSVVCFIRESCSLLLSKAPCPGKGGPSPALSNHHLWLAIVWDRPSRTQKKKKRGKKRKNSEKF